MWKIFATLLQYTEVCRLRFCHCISFRSRFELWLDHRGTFMIDSDWTKLELSYTSLICDPRIYWYSSWLTQSLLSVLAENPSQIIATALLNDWGYMVVCVMVRHFYFGLICQMNVIAELLRFILVQLYKPRLYWRSIFKENIFFYEKSS